MPSGKSIKRVGNYLRKTLSSLNSLCFGDYHKLPNTPLSSPFSCSRHCPEDSRTDEFYSDLPDEQESEPQKAKQSVKSNVKVPEEASYESAYQQEKKQKVQRLHKRDGQSSDVVTRGGGDMLAQKMKDLHMMDLEDADHGLDVKEALHCYSRIRSPVYLDIVDNFFMDMYYEFSDPHTSYGINSLRRKTASFRL